MGLNELEIEKELRAAGFNRTARNVHSIYLKVGFFCILAGFMSIFFTRIRIFSLSKKIAPQLTFSRLWRINMRKWSMREKANSYLKAITLLH